MEDEEKQPCGLFRVDINPKKAGSFDPISQPEGGGFHPPPPPSDLGRGATKILVIWHVRKPCRDEESREISTLKVKAVFKLCKFMLILCICLYFLLYLINQKFFEPQNHMNFVSNRFRTFLKQKTARFSILSFVFYWFANFLCISLCLQLMYFIVFLPGIV